VSLSAQNRRCHPKSNFG